MQHLMSRQVGRLRMCIDAAEAGKRVLYVCATTEYADRVKSLIPEHLREKLTVWDASSEPNPRQQRNTDETTWIDDEVWLKV